MARRGYGHHNDPDPDERDERAVVTPLEETPSPDPVPLTPEEEAKQQEINQLQAYRDKVMGDLDRQEREAHAVHDATEKRCERITADRATVLAEYDERLAAIEAKYPPA